MCVSNQHTHTILCGVPQNKNKIWIAFLMTLLEYTSTLAKRNALKTYWN